MHPPTQTDMSQAAPRVSDTAASSEEAKHLASLAEAAAKPKAGKAQAAASIANGDVGSAASGFTSPTKSNARRSENSATAAGEAAASTKSQPADAARVAEHKSFQEHFKRRRRRGGAQMVIKFIAWLTAAAAALMVLSDVSLRRFAEHRCSSLLRYVCIEGRAFCYSSALPNTFSCGLQSAALPACVPAQRAALQPPTEQADTF